MQICYVSSGTCSIPFDCFGLPWKLSSNLSVKVEHKVQTFTSGQHCNILQSETNTKAFS